MSSTYLFVLYPPPYHKAQSSYFPLNRKTGAQVLANAKKCVFLTYFHL